MKNHISRKINKPSRLILIIFLALAIWSIRTIELNAKNIVTLEYLLSEQPCNANDRIFDIEFSSNNQLVAVSNWRSDINDSWKARIWSVENGKVIQDFDYSQEYATYATSIALSDDGSYLLTGGSKSASIWDANTGSHLHTLIRQMNDTQGTTLLFTPDSKFAITGGFDGVSLWNAVNGKLFIVLKGEMDQSSNQIVRVSPDGEYIMTFNLTKREAYISLLYTGELVHKFDKTINGIFSPNGKYIAIYGDKGLSLIDFDTFKVLRTFDSQKNRIINWEFSDNGKYLLIIDGQVKLWETETGKSIFESQGISYANVIGILPDSSHLVVPQVDAHNDFSRKIGIWNIPSKTLVREFQMEASDISTFAFSSDGKLLAIGTFEGVVQLWDLQQGKKLRDFC